jgi:(E)-4-hydroxy-3-methylbut-2-enyl-diphosphate synthase
MSNSINPRRFAQRVTVGKVAMGGNAPIVVQSMTNTDTADAQGTGRFMSWQKPARNWYV